MGRGGRTITVGCQGPQKFFQVPKSLENFLLSAPLQPMTANSDCAHGGQPKSPRPISAGRHVFILGPGASRRKEQEDGKSDVSQSGRSLLGSVRKREPDSEGRVSAGQCTGTQFRRRAVSLGQGARGMGNHVCGGGVKHGTEKIHGCYEHRT